MRFFLKQNLFIPSTHLVTSNNLHSSTSRIYTDYIISNQIKQGKLKQSSGRNSLLTERKFKNTFHVKNVELVPQV